MPKTTVAHEPWCAEHVGPAEGLLETCCTKGVDFGPLMPRHPGDTEDDTRGSMFAQLREDDAEPVAMIDYAPGRGGQIDLGALHAVRAALVDDPSELLLAIDETLAQLESRVSA